MIIEIEVKNKIARLKAYNPVVTHNNDYYVRFSFDSEWDEYNTKTARFIWDNEYTDVLFTGNECNIPLIPATKKLEIGVFAGSLRTSTPVVIKTNKSILFESGTPVDPTPSVYEQIMTELANRQEKLVAGEGIQIDENNVISADAGTTDHSELDNLDYDGSGHTGFQKEVTQDNKIDYSLIDNTPTIPSKLSELEGDQYHRVITDKDYYYRWLLSTKVTNEVDEEGDQENVPNEHAVIAFTENKFVKKDGSKVLSDNNYTTTEKEKLAVLENYDDTELKSQIDEKVDLSDIQAYGMLDIQNVLDQGKREQTRVINSSGAITSTGGSQRDIRVFDLNKFYFKSYTLDTPSATSTASQYLIAFYKDGLLNDDGSINDSESTNLFINNSGIQNDSTGINRTIIFENISIPSDAKYVVFSYRRQPEYQKDLIGFAKKDLSKSVIDENYVHTDNNYTNADKTKVDEIPAKKVKLIYNNGQLEFLSKIKKDSNNNDVYISLMAYMPNSNSSHSNQSYSFGEITSKYSDGRRYQFIKTANDDVAPLHFNDDYRGAGHGDNGGYKYTFSYINDAPVFTESNIGEIWQSYSSGGSLRKLLIYKVENDDVNKKNVVFVFEPASDDISTLNSYDRAIIYRTSEIPSRTLQKDGVEYTADENISRTQILPSVQNVEVKIFSENSEITEDGVYESNYFDVVEKYEILYIPDMINALKNNVGQNTNESYYKGNYDKYCTITNTYRYCERGVLTIFQAVEWDKEVNLNWVAFIQSATMSKTNHFRIPNTTFKRNSDNTRSGMTGYTEKKYVFARNGSDIPENVDNCWLDDSNPPSRFYQVVEPKNGDFSFCMGYCSDYGTERKFSDGTLTKICGSLFYTTQKFYPYYLSASAIAEDGKTNDPTLSGKITNQFTSAVSYRIPINNSYDEDMLVCWYYVNDDIYLVLDCQKEVNKFVKLPHEFIGRKISFVEKYGKIECEYKFVTNDGIKIKVGIPDGDTVGYGSAVIKLSK